MATRPLFYRAGGRRRRQALQPVRPRVAHRRTVNDLLLRASGLVRVGAAEATKNLRGADPSSSLFLTQPQLNAARGDAGTRVPPSLERLAHCAGTGTCDDRPAPIPKENQPR